MKLNEDRDIRKYKVKVILIGRIWMPYNKNQKFCEVLILEM